MYLPNTEGMIELTEEGVAKVLTDMCGCYVLSKKGLNDIFPSEVVYVGRSDNVKERLLEHLSDPEKANKVTHYFIISTANEEEAFIEECKYYHIYKDTESLELLNKIHPARPEGSDIECPVEGCNELKSD